MPFAGLCETLESRMLLCVSHQQPTELDPLALASGHLDHSAEWYEPFQTVSLSAAPDAPGLLPSFATNAAGLPLLTSRADGQGLKVFLDFDGFGTKLPFSLNEDTSTYNTEEQTAIYYTWRDMVSYFSALNVNITTVQPPTGGNNPLFAWHLTSNSISGGYAYVGELSNDQPQGFNESANAVSRRSGIAHEIGHLLGLEHQSEYTQSGIKQEYTDGIDDRHRAVIGVDRNENVRQWFYGRSSLGASVFQNDLLTMADLIKGHTGGDGMRPDDYTSTTPIPSSGFVNGFLERYTDQDVFSFSVTGNPQTYNIAAVPTFESAASPRIELRDSGGNLIASRDDADFRTSNDKNNSVEFSKPLPIGNYTVTIRSSGDISEIGEYMLAVSSIGNGNWRTQDIGSPFRGGARYYNSSTNTTTQVAGGRGVQSGGDEFRFTYTRVSVGNSSISVPVTAVQWADGKALPIAGIMMRDTLEPDSAFAMAAFTPIGAIQFSYREATGGPVITSILTGTYQNLSVSSTTQFILTAQRTDGTYQSLPLPIAQFGGNNAAYAGLIAASDNARYTTSVTFAPVTVTGFIGFPSPVYNALPVPTGLSAALPPGANSSVTLNWTDVTGETAYQIERSADGVTFAPIGDVAANVTSYTDVNVWGSNQWFYRVAAKDSFGASVPSSPVTIRNKPSAASLLPADYQPASIYVDSPQTGLLLNWRDVQGDEGYRVERSSDNINFSVLGSTASNHNAFNDFGVTAGAVYYYRITPLTSIGDGVARSFTFIARASAIPAPYPAIAGRTASSISISWSVIEDATNYSIQSSPDGLAWFDLATVPSSVTSYTANGLKPFQPYYYRVAAALHETRGTPSGLVLALTLPSNPVPSPWSSRDVGDTGGLGASSFDSVSGIFTVAGAGQPYAAPTRDSLHLASVPIAGDGTIVARILSPDPDSPSSELGITIRATAERDDVPLAAISSEAGAAYSGARYSDSDYIYGGELRSVSGPFWAKLQRVGNEISFYTSDDGVTWDFDSTVSIPNLGTVARFGLFNQSGYSTVISRQQFDSVAVTGTIATSPLPPAITIAASASPTPVTGTSSTLNVLASDDGGASNLTYFWEPLDWPGAPDPAHKPTFSANNSISAFTTTANFTQAGEYQFNATVTDAIGQTASSSVNLTVVSTATSVSVSPSEMIVAPASVHQFSAQLLNQFSEPLAGGAVSWSTNSGLIDENGLWLSGTAPQLCTISATIDGITGQANPVIGLGTLEQNFRVDTLPQSIQVTLNSQVNPFTIAPGDLEVFNLSTGSNYTGMFYPAYDGNAGLLWFFDGAVLPDGNYRAGLLNSSISYGNLPYVSGQPLEFFVFAGDANRDRFVDTTDFNILSANFGGANTVFTQGNFDGLSSVDSVDFGLLVSNYGQRLAALSSVSNLAMSQASGPFASGLPPLNREDLVELLE